MLVKKASLPGPFLPAVVAVAVAVVAVQAAESAQVQALPEIQVVVLELEVLPAEAVVQREVMPEQVVLHLQEFV